jgi:DNA-binding Lrp family transcriptional regulator
MDNFNTKLSNMPRGRLARSSNLQLKIMRELASPRRFGSSLRPTYSGIAKKLGIDEETVRVRVRQAQRTGLILGWQLAINPHLLGREATSVLLEVKDPSSKPAMISKIKLIDEVVLIMDFYDRPLRVVFYYENERDKERRLDLIKSICGDENPTAWQVGYAPSNVKLKRTDWQILKALRSDSMQSNAEIAKEVRVSARTVKRRLSLMTETGAIHSFAMGDVKRMPGMAYYFLVDCPNEKKKREVDEQILGRLENAVFVDTANKQFSQYSAVFHNVGEADETYRWIKRLDGAENTRMSLMREIISVSDWFDKEIDSHLEQSGYS